MASIWTDTDGCRALEIARRKKREGDIAGALKFAKKSQNLFSNPEADDFMASLSDLPPSNSSPFTSGTSTPATPSGDGPTLRKPKETEQRPGRQNSEFSSEQVAVVQRVRKYKHHQYYEILELKSEATDTQIKKRFVLHINNC
jgi:DnaJ family protein B protein 12